MTTMRGEELNPGIFKISLTLEIFVERPVCFMRSTGAEGTVYGG
uniref:Apolipoprotein B mRNA editing enzyme, catalytic polypeptide 1 n=1 Tax=Nannospalax galili TaxID=1026970 RepID=A0A8C6WCL2_NANGA